MNTPEEYEQLKLGQLSRNVHNYLVHSECEPDLTIDPKYFEHSGYASIDFYDVDGNTVVLYPRESKVIAFIRTDN